MNSSQWGEKSKKLPKYIRKIKKYFKQRIKLY